jgi:hypothetical protein
MTALFAIGRFLKGIPWQVYALLALAAAIGTGIALVKDAISDAGKAGDKAGYTRAMNEMTEKARIIAAQADDLARKIRSKNDEQARTIAARADDLRVRGSGAARCTNPVRPASPVRHQPASGGGDAAPTTMPPEDRGAVPWNWLVGQAERCDLNRSEVLSWREWHKALLNSKPGT